MDSSTYAFGSRGLAMAVLVALAFSGSAVAAAIPEDGSAVPGNVHPGCENLDAKACVESGIVAMGGRTKLAGIATAHYDIISHLALTEQSYRQQPFITAYERDDMTIDFGKGRVRDVAHVTWPESDPHQSEITQTLIATPAGGVYHSERGDTPAQLADLAQVGDALALGPERLLLTAAAASDLHYAPSQWLRATPHAVVEFTWQGTPVRVLLNGSNHLPDAFETTRGFQDFWFAWGDVDQRVYYDNWHIVQGVVLPTNRVEARNGVIWQSAQILDAHFNAALDEKDFAMDARAVTASAQAKGWNRTFSDKNRVELAPGIELFRGSWNATLIRQDDGVLVLEAPISPGYVQGVFDKARAEYPDVPVKGVITTSDSWPHMAGVREAVAQGLPVYALDLNQPILDRLIAAPHRLQPDRLQSEPKPAHWNIVSKRLEVGRGANRALLIPLRGATTERQFMVYFPEHRLLYASDTLVVNPDHTLYDPQMMHEVIQAAEREHLQVDTVYAMHEGPTPWKDVVKMVDAALH